MVEKQQNILSYFATLLKGSKVVEKQQNIQSYLWTLLKMLRWYKNQKIYNHIHPLSWRVLRYEGIFYSVQTSRNKRKNQLYLSVIFGTLINSYLICCEKLY